MAKPIIVLVHGAFCNSSCWDKVIPPLKKQGHQVVAFANPLRGLGYDDEHLMSLLKVLENEKDSDGRTGKDKGVVLVGHSYGCAVITNAVPGGNKSVGAMVYVAGAAPKAGDPLVHLKDKLAQQARALLDPPNEEMDPKDLVAREFRQVEMSGCEFYLRQDRFAEVLNGDEASTEESSVMASNQRPLSTAPLRQNSKIEGWKGRKTWFIIPKKDQVFPHEEQCASAAYASTKERTTVFENAQHMLILKHAGDVAAIIEKAAGQIQK
ncbi:alpha/beta fold hydrolase [Streptomyces marincola]|uniref:AB hydrolase-1 domain-containing protein n=1 Tax=Streptomyces marincola TaxID=2878388 RepID=A0A1W7CYA6_9ACTN|nr:alpha/beta fold hydrolase [Streptomyces marincola]ARQ69794.1 hypothetical protein CAG99_13790 [Streptomyces marincola]